MIQSVKNSFRIKILSLLLAVGMIFTSRHVRAEETEKDPASQPDPAPATMPEVVVSGKAEKRKKTYQVEKASSVKYTEPLLDTPQTISVIPETLSQEQSATTLRQVLSNVPGISMQAGEGGTPAGDQMTIRGFSARTDIFVDGVRDIGGYTRDPFNFEEVEVAKGPSSSYTGRGSTGASVNLVSKEAQLDPFYRGSVGFGTDEYKRTTIDLNQPLKYKDKGLDGAAFRLNAMLHRADTPGRKVAQNERWGLAPSLAFGLETATRLILNYFYMYQDNIPDYGIPWVPNTNTALPNYRDYPAPVDGSNFYGLSGRDYEKVRTNIFTARFEHDFNDDMTLRHQFRFGRNYRDSLITAPRFASNASTDIRRSDEKSRDQIQTIFANQTDLLSHFETFGWDHNLVTGMEFVSERDRNHDRQPTGPNSPDTDLYGPDPSDPYLEAYARTGRKATAKSGSFAMYAFDTIDFNEKWSINGGLRFDYFDMDYGGTTGPSLNRTDKFLSWNAGVVYKPLPNGSFYFGYATSVNPSAEGLTLSSSATSSANFQADPEKSRTFEIGTKWSLFDEKLSLNAAVFNTDKTNSRTQDPNDPNDTIVLNGAQRVQGIELGATGNLTEDWRIYAAYTFLHSKIRDTLSAAEIGHELSNTPKNSFSFWTSYDLPFGFQLGTGLRFIDTRFNSTANTRKAPAYLIWDAMLAYRLNENITFRLNGQNLTDQEYIDQVGGGHFIPGVGRAAILSTEFDF